MRILRNVLVGGLVVLVLNGCAPDGRDSYVAPKAPDSQLATLKASYNVHVDDIDGDRVDPTFSLSGKGTEVMPGVHKLIVFVKSPAMGGSPAGSGLTINIPLGPQDNECYFKFICEKGHAYEFSRRGMFNNDLMVTDLNTGRKMDIESDGPD